MTVQNGISTDFYISQSSALYSQHLSFLYISYLQSSITSLT